MKCGVWVLENLFGVFFFLLLVDVLGLEDLDSVLDFFDFESRLWLVCERMERYRIDFVCASCYVRMDFFGFVLESFDVVGGYRELLFE